jgi:hypothetical protein
MRDDRPQTADGHGVTAIMHEVGVSKTTFWRWQEYFAEAGVEGLVEGRSKQLTCHGDDSDAAGAPL